MILYLHCFLNGTESLFQRRGEGRETGNLGKSWPLKGFHISMENPAKTLETLPQFIAQSGKTAVKMEKFRDFMIKFYRTTQNDPLSEAQNSIFEKRLNQILPHLNHTPDHPPYAWMIQKAIEELAEKRGSSEKLISDYIKKEYKDLPWAHDTLLNHHLKNLCASGDIVLTKNQTYVFPGLLSDKTPSKKTTKNKHVGKDEDWDLHSKKKNKPQKAVRKKYKVKKEDMDHLIAEKRPSCDPEGQDVLKEVPEGQDVFKEIPEGQDVLKELPKGQVVLSEVPEREDVLKEVPEREDVLKEVPKGQVVLNEVPKGQDVLNEVCDMEIVEICSSDAQLNLNPNPKGQQLNAEAHLIPKKRPSCDSGEEQSLIEVHVMQDASLNQEGKKLNDDQTPCNSPPCFDHHVVLESTELLENPQEFAVVAPELSCNDELKQVQCRLPLEVIDDTTQNQRSEQMLLSSDGTEETLDEYMQSLEPITNIPKFGLQQMEYGEHRAMLTQTKPTEVLYQQTIPDLKPTTDENKCVPQSNPVHSSGTDQVRRIVCKFKYRAPGKIAKENQTKKQQIDKHDPLLEQGQKQLDARDSEPIINPNEVRLLSGSGKGLHGQKQLDAQDSEGTTGMQRKLRSGKTLGQEGTGKMQRKLQSWKNKSAKHLKPHVSVEMHDDDDDDDDDDDEDSNESSDFLNLEQSCQPDDDDATPLKTEYRGRGRPRKVKPELCGSGKIITTSTKKKTAEEEEQQQQNLLEMESEKPKRNNKKGRGRPPNLKKKVVMPEIRRGRGRPRKTAIQ